MKIVINDIAASSGGALTILRSFYQFIKQHDTENEYVFLLGDYYIEETENIRVLVFPEVKKSKAKRLLFDFLTGKNVINQLSPDYVLSLQNIITFGVKAKQGVYIHQAIPFQRAKRFSLLKKEEREFAVYQWVIGSIIKLSARCADEVFVQTNWMKRAVGDMAGIKEQKIQVVPVAPQPFSVVGKTAFQNNLFFYPAAESIYKNHKCIYDAVLKLNEEGIIDFEVILTIDKEPATNFRYVGMLNRKEMADYYQMATLLFPSYIETVGLPLEEAKIFGTLILAADCEYAHEVLDTYDNAFYFNPKDSEELAALMRKVIDRKLVPQPVEIQQKEDGNTWQVMLTTINDDRV